LKILLRRILLAFLIGVGATGVLWILATSAATHGFTTTAKALFWQNSLLQQFVPLPDIGSAEHPFPEGSPLTILAYLASFPFGILIYGIAAFLTLRLQSSRSISGRSA
jgi:hypothetical protein